ncbi:MAG: hypothetical protein Q8Q08_12985 [Candidatus Omnitrophota bacterium]|nr:hypothetical protein [Candidatus Omnitrophota bacterium]
MKPKLILNAGIYDLCHKGHIKLLRAMDAMRKKGGDGGKLVIVLHDDESAFKIKDKVPIQDQYQRLRNLRLVIAPHEIVFCSSTDPGKQFEAIYAWHNETHDITYVRGDDLTESFPGSKTLDRLCIPICYLPYTKGVSSTYLREQLENL